MTTYFVKGPAELSGSVALQGAKNSALKHIIAPLLTNDAFKLKNIPAISSSVNPAKIVSLQGAKVNWEDKNTLAIDSTHVNSSIPIPEDLFFHTSGGILLIPIMATKYGEITIQKAKTKKETGGDQIGRSLTLVNNTLKKLGIENSESDNFLHYKLMNKNSLDFEIPERSFGVSVMALFTAILRDGESKFYRPTRNSEFQDILAMIRKMGGQVKFTDDKMTVVGGNKLKGVTYENMYDKHDFVTFLSAALCTESEITIENVQYDKMKLHCLDDFLKQSNVHIEYDKKKDRCHVYKNRINNLKPVKLIASECPEFVTEWQVLLSPLFAIINGDSSITEGIFPNRMRHWEELSKFGASFKYFKHPDYPEVSGDPRAVYVFGGQKLMAAEAISKDVRCGAACIIAALVSSGESKIIDKDDNIKRGYEDLSERLSVLGAIVKHD